MKKTISTMLVLGIAFNILAVSCSTEERSNEVYQDPVGKNVLSKMEVKDASLDKKLEYKKYYLKEATKLINELGISSKDLISIASSYKSKKQQENTFLLKDVVALAKSKNKNISTEENDKFKVLENAFKDLEERDFAISIYIPFAEKLQNIPSKGTASRVAEEKNIFIFEEQDNSSQLAFEGEILNEDGNWITYDQLITEEMAEDLADQGKMVAVVGLQDLAILDDGGMYTGGTGTSGGSTGGTGGTTASTQSALKILDMAVKSHKESWIAGASELTIRGYKNYNGTINDVFYSNSTSHGGYLELIFRKYSRKEVKNQNMITLNAQTTYNINKNEIGNLYYVIYEADNFPSTVRYASPGGVAIRYYSSDGAYIANATQYGIGPIYNMPYIENSEIKYRTYFN